MGSDRVDDCEPAAVTWRVSQWDPTTRAGTIVRGPDERAFGPDDHEVHELRPGQPVDVTFAADAIVSLRPKPLSTAWAKLEAGRALLDSELQAALGAMAGLPPLGSVWSHTRVAVGGLRAVGFGPETELLLVRSTSGLGVFDARGTRLARDPGAADLDTEHGQRGIGPLAGATVTMSDDPRPRSKTADGWALYRVGPHAIVTSAQHTGGLTRPTGAFRVPTLDEIRGFAWSDSGRCLAIADGGHSVDVYVRR